MQASSYYLSSILPSIFPNQIAAIIMIVCPTVASSIPAEQPPASPPLVAGLPPVLILLPMHDFIEIPLANKFNFIKAFEAPEGRDEFLEANKESIRVILCTGFTPITAQVIKKLPRLECVIAVSTGVNMIDLDACQERGITVTNAGSAYSEDTADYGVGLFIDVFRRISAADSYVRKGLWSFNGEYRLGSSLGGKRVGMIGLGRIGSDIARRVASFGCRVSYHARTKKPEVPYEYYSEVLQLATDSDALVVCCSLTEQTKHIVNRDVLLALGKEGVVINIGRGPLVDEKELVRCLLDGEIRGAGMDVFEHEPRVPEELYKMENVVLSPHTAPLTPESLDSVVELVQTNLTSFFENKPLLSVVV